LFFLKLGRKAFTLFAPKQECYEIKDKHREKKKKKVSETGKTDRG